jgi:dienelactone hydrolase
MEAVQIMTPAGAVVELLGEAFEGPRDPRSTWFVSNAPDSGIFGTLAGLTPQEASRAPGPGRRSAAAHTSHLAFSLRVSAAKLRGEEPAVNWAESWAVSSVDERGWAGLRASLRADYHAAIAAARDLDGVDPSRIVLWGTSYAGGHVLPVAVADGDIAAVVSLTPAMDGLAALLALARHGGPRRLVPLVLHGLRDAAHALTRRSPHVIPVVGSPGSVAIITTDGAVEAYTALAGPTWRNEVCARTALEVAFNRPLRFAARLRCPLLVQIGSGDRVAPPAAAQRAATKAGRRAETRTYPIDHFDVYVGQWQQRALADQLEFLGGHLGARPVADRQTVAA